MVQWYIKGYDSQVELFSLNMSGALSKTEISRVLKLIYAQHLTIEEICQSSLRKNMAGYIPLLESRASGNTIEIGENPHFVAQKR